MKQYHVRITDQALKDMEEIYRYIAEELLSPQNALRQYERIAQGIESLSSFPKRCKLFTSQRERALGMRALLVDHYTAVFVADDSQNAVTVLRVLYSASDITTRLHDEK